MAITFDDLPDAKPSAITFDDLPDASPVRFDDLPSSSPQASPASDNIEPGQPSFLPKKSTVVDGKLVDVPPTQEEIDTAMQSQRGRIPMVPLPKPGDPGFQQIWDAVGGMFGVKSGPAPDSESGAGIAAIEKTAESFTTPENVGILAGAAATGGIVPSSVRLIAGLFAAQMGKSLVSEEIPAAIEAVKEHGITSPEAGAAIASAGATGLMTAGAGGHALERPSATPEVIAARQAATAKVAAAGAPRAAQVVADAPEVVTALAEVQKHVADKMGVEPAVEEPPAPETQPAAPVEDIHSGEAEFLGDEFTTQPTTKGTVTTNEIQTQDEGQKGRQEKLLTQPAAPADVPTTEAKPVVAITKPDGTTEAAKPLTEGPHIISTVLDEGDGKYLAGDAYNSPHQKGAGNIFETHLAGERAFGEGKSAFLIQDEKGDIRVTQDREEAARIAEAAGQRKSGTGKLQSEDLDPDWSPADAASQDEAVRQFKEAYKAYEESQKREEEERRKRKSKQGAAIEISKDISLKSKEEIASEQIANDASMVGDLISNLEADKALPLSQLNFERWMRRKGFEDEEIASELQELEAGSPTELFQEWKKEVEARRKSELNEKLGTRSHRKGQYELVEGIIKLKGMPRPDSEAGRAWSGELNDLLATKKGTDAMLFRSTGKSLDTIREGLVEMGFKFDTIDDMIKAVKERLRTGKQQYGEFFPDEHASDSVIESSRMRLRSAESGSTKIPEMIWDAANHIYKVGMDFARWSAEMLRQLGEKIRPFLKETWARMQSESGGVINPSFKGLFSELTKLKKFDEFKKAVNTLSARGQRTYLETRRIIEMTNSEIPDPVRREAIGTWIEAKGEADRTGETQQQVLDRWAARNAVPKYQAGYEAARDLTPQEQAFAGRVEAYYANKLGVARAWGVLTSGLDAYVNRIFKPSSGKTAAALTGGRIKPTATFQKHRFYDTAFDAEQPKIDPTTGATISGMEHETKDIGERMAIYAMELNKVIAHRKLIADLSKTTAPDGMPAVIPTGTMKTITDASGDPQAQLVFPDTKLNAVNQLTGDPQSTHGYKPIKNNWLLKDWKWVGTGEDGAPVLMQSDLAVHPDLWSHVNNITRGSALRDWQHSESQSHAEALLKLGIKGVEGAQSLAKEAMFSLSGFHYATLGEHVLEHRVNPFGEAAKSVLNVVTSPIKPLHQMVVRSLNMGPVDYNDPKVAMWMQHSLMLAPDHASARQFMEGVGGTSGIAALTKRINDAARKSKWALPVRPLTEAANLFGKMASVISDDLFMRYIPALKLRMADTILERNLHLYRNEIAAGTVKTADVRYLTATQVNAAMSHLNLADIGRNPTFQHLLSLGVLAPDFTESRGRFLAQTAKGFVNKSGREQMTALLLGGGIAYATIRVINQLLDDDPHFELKNSFSVISGNRRYEVRSIQGDLIKLLANKNQFVQGRLSPLAKAMWQEFGGTNYRGEKMTQRDILGELLGSYIPISIREIPGLRELQDTSRNNPVSPLEQFAGTMGIHTSRYSPITETYQLAKSWKESVNIPTDNAVYPVSKYSQLLYALEDGDSDRAREAYLKLKEELPRAKIASGFKESVMHPFTGTLDNDRRFERSLSGLDRQMYRRATKVRQEIMLRFEQLPK